LEIEDKAERLHALIERLAEVAVTVTMAAHDNGEVKALNDLPLWQTLNRIAEEVGLQNDRALREAFLSLCASIDADIQSIPIKKESVRSTWSNRVTVISKVFDAENFGSTTRKAFNKHFTAGNLEALDSISERFRAVGVKESSWEELQAALGAVRDVIDALNLSARLDGRVAAVLHHYLQQMESVYAQATDFGDEMFWKIYKETFATFAQIHPLIAELENAEEVKSKLVVAWEKLTSKSIAGVSLGANIATLATALYPVLGPG
jgi:hypothetical protein